MLYSAAILFDFHEFRTGVYLAKAYVVRRNAAGEFDHVHHTAKATGLGIYNITLDEPLERALQLVEALRHGAVAEAHRKGTKKVPTLAGLLGDKSKERENVLRYIHHRTTELLTLCQQHGWPVTLKLDARRVPQDYLVPFAETAYLPEARIIVGDDGINYQLRLRDSAGKVSPIRHHQVVIITNHPAPGWVVIDGQWQRVGPLNGAQFKPFLSKDGVQVGPDAAPQYWREFVVRLAEKMPLEAHGFAYAECNRPDHLQLSARRHPFEERYELYAEFAYGKKIFASNSPDTTATSYTLRPPLRLTRIVRDPAAEAALLAPLAAADLRPVAGSNAYRLPEADGAFGAVRWLLDHQEKLAAAGVVVVPPERDGQRFSHHTGTFTLSVEDHNDWLDLKGRVQVGPHLIPFVQLVRYLQQGTRTFPLPDGEVFLIPEEWFARYRPSLQLARVEGRKVRMARSQAPLLAPLGLVPATDDEARQRAAAFTPGPELRATLRPYQLDGARWLVRHYHEGLGACLADDMGLGKTLQTIAVLLYAKSRMGTETRPPATVAAAQMDLFAPPASDEVFLQPLRALVVLPASLVFNWRNELARFAPQLTVEVHTGAQRQKDGRILRRFDVILTTYQTALRDIDWLSDIAFSYVVLDESQQIKNRQSKIFKALNELQAEHRISLSGTPIENSLSDLWSQMQFINPGLLRHFAFFKKNFITPIEVHGDEKKKQQLRQLVAPHLLRRTKAEVAPDLPRLDVQNYYCEMSPAQRKAYETEKSAARNALLGHFDPADGPYKLRVIQTLTRLRQIANHPVLAAEDYARDSGKFTEVLEQWQTLYRAGHKVLIFSSMVRHLTLFRRELEKINAPYAWITGEVSSQARAAEVARFQQDPAVQTFFISIKAGGTGLNLTAADYVFILDPWWNPTIEDQAIARAHRIGRQGNVFARKFLSRNTLEEKISKLQERKKQLAEDIIGAEGKLDLDREELAFLLA